MIANEATTSLSEPLLLWMRNKRLAVTGSILVEPSSQKRPATLKLCNQKLKNPALTSQFKEWLTGFHVDPESNIDTHLLKLQEHLIKGASIFERDKKGPKNKWISARSWFLITKRGAAKKCMRSAMATLRLRSSSVVFLAWAACWPNVYLGHHSFGEFLENQGAMT